MAQQQHELESDANHDHLIYAIVSIFSILSTIALAMRLFSKYLKGVRVDYDDYLVIISWVRLFFSTQPLNIG